jgi:hypothetical protein
MVGAGKVNGLQRLWPRSLEAVLRHFVLPLGYRVRPCVVETNECPARVTIVLG